MVKILAEDITHEVNIVEEAPIEGQTTGNIYIEGIFLQADVKNRNGRVYPFGCVANAVSRYEQEYINTGRSLGELGHPDSGAINLHLASHKIESLRADGKNFIGRAKLLDTPMGRIAKELVREGVKLGVSLRGYGSITERDGTKYVGEDFVLSTVDIVADPSAPDAFVSGIMENSQNYFDSGLLLQEQYDYIKEAVNKTSRKRKITEEDLLKIFEGFCKTLK